MFRGTAQVTSNIRGKSSKEREKKQKHKDHSLTGPRGNHPRPNHQASGSTGAVVEPDLGKAGPRMPARLQATARTSASGVPSLSPRDQFIYSLLTGSSPPLAALSSVWASLPAPNWLPHPLFGVCQLLTCHNMKLIFVCLFGVSGFLFCLSVCLFHGKVPSHCLEFHSLWVGPELGVLTSPIAPPCPVRSFSYLPHCSWCWLLFCTAQPLLVVIIRLLAPACSALWALCTLF